MKCSLYFQEVYSFIGDKLVEQMLWFWLHKAGELLHHPYPYNME